MGFKAPVFSSDSKTSHFERERDSTFALLCQAQAFPVPVSRYWLEKWIYFWRILEYCGFDFLLSLLNKHFYCLWWCIEFLVILEPIGFKAPAFSTDMKSITISREVSQPFELSCRAQAYPSPSFRYKLSKIQLPNLNLHIVDFRWSNWLCSKIDKLKLFFINSQFFQ